MKVLKIIGCIVAALATAVGVLYFIGSREELPPITTDSGAEA